MKGKIGLSRSSEFTSVAELESDHTAMYDQVRLQCPMLFLQHHLPFSRVLGLTEEGTPPSLSLCSLPLPSGCTHGIWKFLGQALISSTAATYAAVVGFLTTAGTPPSLFLKYTLLGVPVVAQWLMNPTRSIRAQVRSWTLLSGLSMQ